MSKHKKNSNLHKVIKALKEAKDRLEGEYSNIPECCIEGFLQGRTYMNVLNSVEGKDVKKLHKWGYVPCEACFKKNKRNKIKLNGMSETGQIISTLIDILSDRSRDA